MIVGIDRNASVEQRLHRGAITQRVLAHAARDLKHATNRPRRHPAIGENFRAIGALEPEFAFAMGHRGLTFGRASIASILATRRQVPWRFAALRAELLR